MYTRCFLKAVVFMLIVSAFFFSMDAFCHAAERIPITTVSKEALDLYLQGRDLAEKLRDQESRQYFEKALVFDPDFPLAHLQLASVMSSAKGFYEHLNRAVELTVICSEGEKLWIEGVQAGVNGFYKKEEELYQKLVKAYPRDPRAYNLLGNFYLDQQFYTKAIEYFEKATQLDPEFTQPYNQLGYANKYIGNYMEAEKAFKSYVSLIPDDPNPLDSYAELLMKMGKFDKSIKNYEKALELNKEFYSSYIGIASNLILQGEHQEARQYLQRMFGAAKDDGDRRDAYLAMTVSYADEGNFEGAIELLNKQYALAERINDTQRMASDLNNMGLIYLETGKFDKALKKFSEALQIVEESELSQNIKNNNKRTYLANMSLIAIERQEFDLADKKINEYQTEVEDLGNLNQIRRLHKLKGMLALEKENYDLALEELDQANFQNPYNLYRIALAYKGKKDFAKAREFSHKAADFNELVDLNYALVRSKAKQLAESL